MNESAAKALTGMSSNPMQSYSQFIGPAQENLRKASEAKAELAGAERGMEAERSLLREQQRGGVEQEYAKKFAEAPQRQQLEGISGQMAEPFIPTKETAGNLGNLFSLINIAGFAIGAGGKRNAQAAMSAMNGMLQGYQQGRADLYKKEKDIFDTNMKQLKARYDMLDKQLKEAVDTYKTDREAGLRKADLAYAQAGADFLKKYSDKVGLAAMYDTFKQAYDTQNRAWTEKTREEDRAERLNRAARAEERAIRREERAEQRFEGQTPAQVAASGGRGGGAIQFRYNAAMTNAGNALAIEIENAATLPLKATPPAAAEVLTNPSKSLTDATRSFFAQKITGEDARAMQQVFAGMQRAITTIEASGRPSGATEGAIKEFGKTMPRAGDNKVSTYLFLAQAKQVMEILVKDLKAAGATPEQIGQAQAAKDRVDNIISWNVKDVNRIIGAGGRTLIDPGVQKSLVSSENLKQLDKELKSKPKKEKAQAGEQIFTDAAGNKAVQRNGKWVEVE